MPSKNQADWPDAEPPKTLTVSTSDPEREQPLLWTADGRPVYVDRRAGYVKGT